MSRKKLVAVTKRDFGNKNLGKCKEKGKGEDFSSVLIQRERGIFSKA